ncbi:hypothetical protein BKA70DRAFT_681907, partial [Coprinopsis sp. MPI-PUGE-AT-0042]
RYIEVCRSSAVFPYPSLSNCKRKPDGVIRWPELKENLMNGQPSRDEELHRLQGLVIPPCGEFALPLGSAMSSSPPWKTTKNAELHDDIEKFMDYIRPTRSEALPARI